MKTTFARAGAIAMLMATLGAAASTASAGDIEIASPWSRPAAAGGNGAGYLRITNTGTNADVLLGGSSEGADRVEVHETTIDDKGVASMKKLDSVEVKGGGSIELKPAGMHLMLIGLKAALKEGDTFKARLKFKTAGEVDVAFPVKASAGPAMSMDHMDMEHMHMDHMDHEHMHMGQ